MLKDAASRNLERSQELKAKNSAWKRTGRRGERRLRLVQLRKNEVVDQEGNVVQRDDVGVLPVRSAPATTGAMAAPAAPGTSGTAVAPAAQGATGTTATSKGKRGRSDEKTGHSPNLKAHRFGQERMETETS